MRSVSAAPEGEDEGGPRARRWCLVLLAVFAALLLVDLPGSWLFDPDETRYAEIPREMLVSGDFVTPRLDGAHYLEKPPLLYWIEAGTQAAFGRRPFVARLPVRLAAFGTAALTALLAEQLAAGAGAWAALVLLSAPLSFTCGRLLLTDGLLALFVTASFVLLRRFLLAREAGRTAHGTLAAVGATVGLGMLTKGLVAVALPGLVFLAWVAILGKWRRIAEFLFSPAPLVFLAVAVPWFAAVEKASPGTLHFFFIHEHLQRFATPEAARPGPIYYFVAVFVAGFLPWTPAFPRALAPLWPPRLQALRSEPDLLFIALWFFVPLVLFSASHSKLAPYLLPALPAAAALVARDLARGNERTPARRSRFLVAAAACAVLYAAAIVALPWVSTFRSGHDLAREAASHDAEVVAYHCFLPSLAWELQRPVPVAEYRGELGSGGDTPAGLFWTKDELWRRWASGKELIVLARRADLPEIMAARPPPTVLLERGKQVLVSNVPPP